MIGSSQAAKETENRVYESRERSELIIGLVGAVGTEIKKVSNYIKDQLKDKYKYKVNYIKISQHIIEKYFNIESPPEETQFDRTWRLMDAGNIARETTGVNSILSLAAAAKISSIRKSDPFDEKKKLQLHSYTHIIDSLKHPDEVTKLREIYPQGFYLIGVHANDADRISYLEDKDLNNDQINRLMARDEDEKVSHGQRVRDTFYMSDFFIHIDDDESPMKTSIQRILKILFGDPYITPLFDEYAMFLAHTAALRSADLSRQVGAVIAKNNEIIGAGANDCPKFGGGLYWPEYYHDKGNSKSYKIDDYEGGRDYKLKEDSNKKEQEEMINRIEKKINDTFEMTKKEGIPDTVNLYGLLKGSPIRDLTEFGRAVHAEMEALLSCARNTISSRDAIMYCTTFPCHNCAKHIIAAGIKRVVYIEPYPKSKAAKLHKDAIYVGFAREKKEMDTKVCFEPFVGIGPRRFFDLFSMHLGSGYKLLRKDQNHKTIDWEEKSSTPRIQMLHSSYLDLEMESSEGYNTLYNKYWGTTLSKEATDEEPK